jgi:uncharacterized protein YgiM (DUF1202 family)
VVAMATGAMAQMTMDPAPADAAPPTKKVALKPAAKPAATKKKPAAEAPLVAPFGENEAAVVNPMSGSVNVRSKAQITSEVIARLKGGDNVMVLKEVTLPHPKANEPARWAQIALPAGTPVWVNSTFLDDGQKVKPAKLNIRGGPGENYPVIGVLHKGDAVKTISTRGEWTAIEAPADTVGFVASHLLSHKEAKTTPVEPVTPPTQVTAVTGSTNDVKPATDVAGTTPVPTPVTPVPVPVPVPVVPVPQPAPADEPPPKRIIQREGIVGDVASIQAPTYFQLESLDNGRVMDYLYTSSTNLTLKMYKGRTVLVSGEESLDERWANTPVLTIQRIQVVK